MMQQLPKVRKIVIVSGNGCTDVRSANWYESARFSLAKVSPSTQVLLPQMPDPHRARESIWLPYLMEIIGEDLEHTLLIGHSSGAEAAMRLAETKKLLGLILVSACHTDLGDENERLRYVYMYLAIMMVM
jgi:predicted alpha/beta hydrolase family esterase